VLHGDTHVPLTHCCPAAHAAPVVPHTHAPLEQLSAVVSQTTQAAPPVPHVLSEDVWQVLFWQQPVGQLVALHTQVPLTHCCPTAQAAPVVPHTHCPLAQVSAVIPQARQVAPEVPHVLNEGVRHVLF
jgi:hypothetical protein